MGSTCTKDLIGGLSSSMSTHYMPGLKVTWYSMNVGYSRVMNLGLVSQCAHPKTLRNIKHIIKLGVKHIAKCDHSRPIHTLYRSGYILCKVIFQTKPVIKQSQTNNREMFSEDY